MSRPETLNELKQLKESGFGGVYPRHGLKLLYWFANDCLYFDDYNKMRWKYDPQRGDFGFHFFKNRFEINGEKLLPDVDLDYYEVGNLHRPGADDLPDYIREDYIPNSVHSDDNMDRIIVSVDDECFEKVYVTEHSNPKHFNKQATYCITRGLIKTIKKQSLEDFLLKTGYLRRQQDSDQGTENAPQREDTKQDNGHVINHDIIIDEQCNCIIL